MFCAKVVHNGMHTKCILFLNLSVVRFALVFVCFCDNLVAVVVVFKFAVVGFRFLQYRAKSLAGKNVSMLDVVQLFILL